LFYEDLNINSNPNYEQLKEKLNPHISIDLIVFGFDAKSLKVLLIERDFHDLHTGKSIRDLKLPGSLVYENETLDHAAYRVLKQLTGLDKIYLDQLAVFDSPGRTKRKVDRAWLQLTTGFEIGRILTVSYYSLIRFDQANGSIAHLKQKAHWTEINDIKQLAFDHNAIIKNGLEHLREKIRSEPVALELLPRKFSLRQLQDLYEVLLGSEMDNRNFRKKIHRLGYFTPLNEMEEAVNHKPARLYKFDKAKYNKIKKESSSFLP
jgi:8-oxo-dGTP diphosphatase